VCHPEARPRFIFVSCWSWDDRRRDAGHRVIIVSYAAPRLVFALFVVASVSGRQATQSCSSVCQCRVVLYDVPRLGDVQSHKSPFSNAPAESTNIWVVFYWLGEVRIR
jgi:hypothetical protein